jgi:hypothetical protein
MKPNEITGAYADGPCRLAGRPPWATRIAQFRCSVKTRMLTRLGGVALLLAGCSHYQWTYVQVEDAVSHTPVSLAKVTASLYDPINADTRRTRSTQVLTQTNGIARIRIPMCSTRGVRAGYLYAGGDRVGRANPNDEVGPEFIVEKEGYDTIALYRSNWDWKKNADIFGGTSPEDPYVVCLTRTLTESSGAASRSQPLSSGTNRAHSRTGSGR